MNVVFAQERAAELARRPVRRGFGGTRRVPPSLINLAAEFYFSQSAPDLKIIAGYCRRQPVRERVRGNPARVSLLLLNDGCHHRTLSASTPLSTKPVSHSLPITSFPPMYGRRTSGILTLPSALRLFSRNAMSIRGGATTVLLRVCTRYFPFSPLTLILSLLA